MPACPAGEEVWRLQSVFAAVRYYLFTSPHCVHVVFAKRAYIIAALSNGLLSQGIGEIVHERKGKSFRERVRFFRVMPGGVDRASRKASRCDFLFSAIVFVALSLRRQVSGAAHKRILLIGDAGNAKSPSSPLAYPTQLERTHLAHWPARESHVPYHFR